MKSMLVPVSVTLWTAARQAPLSLGFSSKNTGVGCHFLLQCMEVKSESELTESCPTLSDPMDCSPPGSFIHGIFQARVLEWVAIAFSDALYYVTQNVNNNNNNNKKPTEGKQKTMKIFLFKNSWGLPWWLRG